MEYLKNLAKEIEHLRLTLQRKQDEFNRLTTEVTLNQNVTKSVEVLISNTNQSANVPCTQYEKQSQIAESTLNGHNVHDKLKMQVGEKLPTWAIERYSRQILLPEIGVKGQERLCAAKVLIVGAGGLGCPAGVYLAGAGVGEIGIVDYDTVDVTNIHRQFLHSERDQFVSKAESAASSLRRNGEIIEKLCPDGMVFNDYAQDQEKCDLPFNLDCSARPKLRSYPGTRRMEKTPRVIPRRSSARSGRPRTSPSTPSSRKRRLRSARRRRVLRNRGRRCMDIALMRALAKMVVTENKDGGRSSN